MCGICGSWGEPEGVDRLGMLGALAHRGPDDEGTFEDRSEIGPVWFGHRRLSILDLSPAGHQPMSSPDGRLTIVFNGEIYNFKELKTELAGFPFVSTSDTEVILAAWQRWGWKCAARLKGMFAFAVWDSVEQRLWLVRDRMGEKPLYYTLQEKRFIFASEVRALLASGAVERRIDSDGLDAYLTFGSTADPYTLVENVRAVEAGTVMRIDRQGIWESPYWSLKNIPEDCGPANRFETVNAVAKSVRQAMRRVMVADVPVGVLLSGGIDSSSNVVLLTDMGFRNLKTFSVIFEGTGQELSEKPWIQLIVDRQKTDHQYVTVTQEEASCWVPCAVEAMDQPTWDGVNTYLVVRAIHEAGLKVAVSGQGSDELFLGYDSRKSFAGLMSLASHTPSVSLLFRALTDRRPGLGDTKYEKLFQAFGAERPASAAYLARHSMFSQGGLERLRGGERPFQGRFVRDKGGLTPLGILSRLEMAHYLKNTLLRDGDQMSMSQSLELRSPFLDSDLVETVASTPPELRVTAKRQKPLLVDAVGQGLPSEIANRVKHGFTLPFNKWLRNGLDISCRPAADLGLDPQAVERVNSRFLAGQDWPRYWTLQVLAAWAVRHKLSPPSS